MNSIPLKLDYDRLIPWNPSELDLLERTFQKYDHDHFSPMEDLEHRCREKVLEEIALNYLENRKKTTFKRKNKIISVRSLEWTPIEKKIFRFAMKEFLSLYQEDSHPLHPNHASCFQHFITRYNSLTPYLRKSNQEIEARYRSQYIRRNQTKDSGEGQTLEDNFLTDDLFFSNEELQNDPILTF